MRKQKRILAINDISCLGRCSLTVALPIISASGVEACVLPTALLSTQTGIKGYTYRDLIDEIPLIKKHWESMNISFDGIYSGFLGSYDQIELVLDIIETFNNNTLVLIDPVIGDNGKLYPVYTEQMIQGMRKLCKKADIITPNLTEAAFLTDTNYLEKDYSVEDIENLLHKLSELGAKNIVLTGVSLDENTLGAACFDVENKKISYLFNKKIQGNFHHTGDVFASTLMSGIMNNFSLEKSTALAVDMAYQSILETQKADTDIMCGVCFEKAIPYLIERLKNER